MPITLDGTLGITTPALTVSGTTTFTGVSTFGSGTALGGTTNPIVAMTGSANNYIQSYIYNSNTGVSASADFVAYANNSTDAHGWADVGFTSSNYADSVYTVTGANEAYLFGSAPSGTTGTGNLVLATDSTGTANAIQFYTGGFTQAKSAAKMVILSSGNVGIGTTSPTYKLDIANSSASHSLARFTQSNTSYNTDVSWVNANSVVSDTLISKRNTGEFWIYQGGASPIAFYTSGSERMRIDTSGNLLVGVSAQPLGSSNSLVCKTIQRSYSAVAQMLGATWVNLFQLDNTGTRVGGNIYIVGNENGAVNVYFAKYTYAYGASTGYTLSGPFDTALVGNNYAVPDLRISGGYVQIKATNGASNGFVDCYVEYFVFN